MFNNNSKKKNILLSSSFGVIEQILGYFISFIFRTVFLSILTKEYLGITGLFTNILLIFSLTDLGIGTIISYRLYAPVKSKNIQKCAALLNFYKKVYAIIALIILIIGIIFFPFINYFIANTNDIPNDVNLNIIYWLFVFQSVASYFYVYYQSLLVADEKNYLISLFNGIYNIITNVIKISVLVFTKNYTFVLAIGIVVNIIYNSIFALYIKKQYKDITEIRKEVLPKNEKKHIFIDSLSLMCHKIGYVVVNGTDSIILSKYIGIGILGLYSNYQLISTAIDTILNKIFGSFVSTLGKFNIDATPDEKYSIFKKLFFLNMWAASFCSVCYFVLINPFIKIWLGDSFVLSTSVSIIISLNIFFNSGSIISSSFINSMGMFVRDKIRPLFQAIINLIVSIVLVKKIGIVGVFIGTLFSTLSTTWWRFGVLLYRDVFKKNVFRYYGYFLFWIIISILCAITLNYIFSFLTDNIIGLLLKFLICALFINSTYFIIFYKTQSFKYFKDLILNKLLKRKSL